MALPFGEEACTQGGVAEEKYEAAVIAFFSLPSSMMVTSLRVMGFIFFLLSIFFLCYSTAASLGNAMEWFDFGVYGFVAYALGKVFFPDANPSVQESTYRHDHDSYRENFLPTIFIAQHPEEQAA
jgi:hypothetical protein